MDERWEWFAPVKFGFLQTAETIRVIKGWLQKYILHYIWFDTKTIIE